MNLSWWPPEDSIPIGPDRVDELFAYLQHAAPAAVAAARAYLAGRYPETEPSVHAVPREQLADLVLDRTMTGITVGTVSVRTPQAGYCVVGIMLLRSGALAIQYHDEDLRPTTVVVRG